MMARIRTHAVYFYVRILAIILAITPLGYNHDHYYHFARPWSSLSPWPWSYYHSAWPWPSLLVLRLIITIIIITSLGHSHGHSHYYHFARPNFLSYPPLIWEIIYIMKYPCIYQKFPRPFHDITNFPHYIYISDLVWPLSISFRERV